MSSCFKGFTPILGILTRNSKIKLILCEGTTRVIKPNLIKKKNIKAGEIMFQFPDCVVCHADSFFLGRRLPILAIHDRLLAGHTYFVLPLDRLPPPTPSTSSSGGGGSGGGGGILSAASLSYLGSPSPSSSPANMRRGAVIKMTGDQNNEDSYCGGGKSPFEYIKDKDGRVHLIKVVPEFITRIITNNGGSSPNNNCGNNSKMIICSTPELEKQYKQLVRGKDQAWSPKLETISEHKIRFSLSAISLSPRRFIGLELKQKEKLSF